jgi:hypothetical protein
MERVQAEENTIEVFKNDIDYFLNDFQEQHNIEDLTEIDMSRWNAALLYIQFHVFPKGCNKLKLKDNIYINNIKLINNNPSNCNSYDYDLVNQVVDYYIYLCLLYGKEVSLMGFSNLTGIARQTLDTWGNNEKSNNSSSDIYKKLTINNEECYVNRLFNNKGNPVGLIAVLNKRYGWSLPGVTKETVNKQITASQLPILKAPDDTNAIDVNAIDTTDPTQ